ncbi:MAG TPA: Ig-like domain-containing protein [Spirochaetota bacterium]|nr:Ig-like domain-containing protein [Spirochaetota bacterium]HPI90709.1 Ig-like domain-containing protein [Spirochaetota bacterium]HPR49976.1 Ig-like domain-containing protein [Spirochaetota bacterium]
MNKNGLYDCIIFSPIADYYVEYEDIMIYGETLTIARIVFISPLKSETYYTMSVTPSITDEEDNPLDKKYVYHFLTNGPNSIAPTVVSITDPLNPGGWALGNIEMLTYDEPTGTDEQPSYRNISIEFSNSIVPSTFSIDIQRTIGQGGDGALPQVINYNWLGGEEFRIFSFDIYDVLVGCVYEISIKGGASGLRDANGNMMAEDFIQYIEF